MKAQIRKYRTDDFEKVFSLWKNTLSGEWILDKSIFQKIIADYCPEESYHHLVAEVDGDIIGFIATQLSLTPELNSSFGGILLIMVSKSCQHRGIGTALLTQAIDYFKRNEVYSINLGFGGDAYFWPGIPGDLYSGINFFYKNGWAFHDIRYDLVLDLNKYSPDNMMLQCLDDLSLTISSCTAADIDQLYAIIKSYSPYWYNFYKRDIDHGRYENIFVVKNRTDQIIGTNLIFQSRSEFFVRSEVWRKMIGENMGGIGYLCIHPEYRQKGIGLALTTYATQYLQQQGISKSLVSWTDLVDFYGKLGYKVWQKYYMSTINFLTEF